MLATCPRCSRANPAEALFCYFDGLALPGSGAAGPLHAGTLPFPAPFVFPGGLSCANFNQLAMGCQKNWVVARDYLREGHWARFMQGIGRLDLAKAARDALAEPDVDQALDQFLAKVPAEVLQPPKLAVEPTVINLGQLRPGTDQKFEVAISNLGMRLLRGSARVDCDWLTIGDGAGAPEIFFQTATEAHLHLRIVGKHFRAEAKPKQGSISVLTNGGEEVVVVRADAPIVPFPEGVFAGATTPREIAVRAKKQPKEAAGLFESGAVEGWYAANGWDYPVQGPAGSGLGAIQQFFEALGLVKPPIVAVEPRSISLAGTEGGKVEFEVRVQSPEAKPVFAHAHSDQPWLKPGAPIFAGNRVTIPVSVPVVPAAGQPSASATLTVRANGNQKFLIPVSINVKPGAMPAFQLVDDAITANPKKAAETTFTAVDSSAVDRTADSGAFGMGRLVYWSGLLGGWSAFVGWLIAELGLGRWVDQSQWLAVILMAVFVSAGIAGGLSLLTGLVAGQWKLRWLPVALAGGAIAGLVGSALGSGLYSLLFWLGGQSVGWTGHVVGWTIMGLAIGSWDGISQLDLVKIRNGLIGGSLGGLIGGLLFNPINLLVGGTMSGRALGFIVLGLCIGLLIGLVQVLLKDGWLTVIDGFRPGRQLILSKKVTTLGTSEKSSLIFIAYGAKGVEPIHAAIERTPKGSFVLYDEESRTGTLLNGKPIDRPRDLRDGDVIQFGINKVRFNERVRTRTE